MPPSASGATRSSRMTPKSLSSRRVAALVLNSSQRKLKMASGSSPLTSQCATMWGCLPTSESPSSECDASSKNSSERLCAARALTAISGPLTAMRSAWGIARASNSPFSLTPCHWLSLNSEIAGDIDVGTMAQRARHGRLDHSEDVLDPVIEFVDDSGQTALEADSYLNFTAEPQIIVGDISEKPADDSGQRKADAAHDGGCLLGAHHRVGLGVIAERPVAASERHRSRHRRGGPLRGGRPR